MRFRPLSNPEVEQLRQYSDLGFKTIRDRGKVPIDEDWPNKGTTDFQTILGWHQEDEINPGVLTGAVNRLLVLDWDVKHLARQFFACHRELLQSAVMVETIRGIHMAFQPPEKNWPSSKFYYNGEQAGDLKADGGQVCWPIAHIGTHVRNFVEGYGLVASEKMPVFDSDMVDLRSAQRPAITREEVRDAVRYLMKIESVAGQEGSRGLVRACAILRDAGLSEAEAMVHLIEWQEKSGRVSPPWPLPALARALKNTYAKGRQ